MGVKEHISFLRQFSKLEWATALEYRANFVTQSIGMFINDIFWIFLWFLLFQRFDTINGWEYRDMLRVFAVLTISYGLVGFLFGNWTRIARFIEHGSLDYYLTMPKNVLLHMLAKFNYYGLGDLVFGTAMVALSIPMTKLPLYLLLVLCSILVMLGWVIITGSLAFYLGRFEHASQAMRESLIIFAGYPFSIFTGTTKFILLFIIPAGFVTGIPVQLLTTFSWKWFFITIGFTAAFFSFAVWFFYRGLRRYESGNVMAMRG